MLLDYDCDTSDINKIVSFIKNKGVGIYSIAHEYNEYDVMKEEFSSLQELRDELNAQENSGWDEDEHVDIFEDFNDKPVNDYLFAETFFSVNITEINN
jgi:cell fate (sporulation/competence/biofilm development) regulator YlbF (YheA/YmcA/DUF963 family)